MKCHCVPDASGLATVVDHLRLFRNRPDVRWTFRVHEQILPSVRDSAAEVRWSDVVIHHTGYVDPSLRGKKLERDLRLLRLEEAEQPDHAFTLFNLGAVYKEMGKTADALACLTRSLERSGPKDSIVRKLYAMITQCHLNLGDNAAALKACREGRGIYPGDLELLFQEGAVLRARGETAGAAACWEECLVLPPADHFASINPGLRGHVTRHHLAAAYRDMGRPAHAEAQWRAALGERPYYDPAWRGLMDLLIKQERWPQLEALAVELEGGPDGALHAGNVRSRVLLARRQFGEARQFVRQTIQRHPQAVEPRLLLSYAYLQEGQDLPGAEQALNDVLALMPDHAEAKHNLAILRLQLGRTNGTPAVQPGISA